MPAQRTFGMDHPASRVVANSYPPSSPLAERGPGRPLCHSGTGTYGVAGAGREFQSARLAGGSAPRDFPDYARLSHREYGHRVGVFRLLDLLEKHGIKATIAMDAMTAENYPYLVRHCLDRGCEFVGHGISVSRMITANMSEEEEREYIRTSLSALTQATGTVPQGWFGPEYGESHRTPQLLAESGLRYVCDWANDEQPYPMTTGAGPFFSLPVLYELDDVVALADRKVTVAAYQRMAHRELRHLASGW